MSMYMTVKLNNETIFEDIQGALVHAVDDFVTKFHGSDLGYGTTIINTAKFARFLAKTHDTEIHDDICEFREDDDLYYESFRIFDPDTAFTAEELRDGLTTGTILFGRKINDKTTLDIIIE